MLPLRNLFGARETSQGMQSDRSLLASGEGAASNDAAPSPEVEAIARGGERFTQGKLAEALAITDEALASRPGSAALHFARGSTLFAWGRVHEARESYERAGATGLDDIDLDLQLGWVSMSLQEFDEAAAHFRKALLRDPDSEEAYVALANALETRGALVASAAEFAQGLSRWPRNYEGLILRAACHFHLKEYEAGVAALREATELDPSRSRAWANLGVVLGGEGRFDEALAALQRAYAIDTANGSAESLMSYATTLREDRRIDESLQVIEESLATYPDPRAHWLRSVLLLELGRCSEAWPQHEFRWMKDPLVSSRRAFLGPVWGGQDPAGKTILLQAEQGLGDVIQFVRFARSLKELGARVIFDSFRDLGDLAHDFHDIDEVAPENRLPQFDFRIPLLSVARVFGTTLDSIPTHVPYIDVQQAFRRRWAKRIESDGCLKVGLVWSGNPKHPRDRYRSIALTRLAMLWDVEGVKWFSLQKSASAEAEIAASGLDIVDLGNNFESFRDTAAAITLLDLVISVDTSVAHLAGALGHPVWVLIAEPPDWRWLIDGDTTPWYPTARIFRQAEHNQWDPAIEKVRAALHERVTSRVEPDALTVGVQHKSIHVGRPQFNLNAGGSRRAAIPTGPTRGAPQLCGVAETRNGIVQTPPLTELSASLAYYGEHRQAELDLVGRFVKPGAWVLEQGCGVGAATLFMARAVGGAGHVIACEGDRLLHEIAQNNVVANRFRNVTLLHQDLEGFASADAATASNRHAAARLGTIDGLRVARLDWIRINSGGAAAMVLAGATEALWRLRPWVFVVTEDGAQEEAALALLRDHAYQCQRFRAPFFNPANYNRRAADIFGGRIASGLFCVPEEVEIDTELEGCTLAS